MKNNTLNKTIASGVAIFSTLISMLIVKGATDTRQTTLSLNTGDYQVSIDEEVIAKKQFLLETSGGSASRTDANGLTVNGESNSNDVTRYVATVGDLFKSSDNYTRSDQIVGGIFKTTEFLNGLPWALTFDESGKVVSASLDRSFFSAVEASGIPGNDLLSNVSDESSAFALDGIVSIPEPSSILGLLAIGTLGAASTLKRKLKSSKSTEKESTKFC